MFTHNDENNLLDARYEAMGFIPGADVEIVRNIWPFPIHLRVGMTEFMVRRRDWPTIKVKLTNSDTPHAFNRHQTPT
jgi:Fe2+ transport system protein FeoA